MSGYDGAWRSVWRGAAHGLVTMYWESGIGSDRPDTPRLSRNLSRNQIAIQKPNLKCPMVKELHTLAGKFWTQLELPKANDAINKQKIRSKIKSLHITVLFDLIGPSADGGELWRGVCRPGLEAGFILLWLNEAALSWNRISFSGVILDPWMSRAVPDNDPDADTVYCISSWQPGMQVTRARTPRAAPSRGATGGGATALRRRACGHPWPWRRRTRRRPTPKALCRRCGGCAFYVLILQHGSFNPTFSPALCACSAVIGPAAQQCRAAVPRSSAAPHSAAQGVSQRLFGGRRASAPGASGRKLRARWG